MNKELEKATESPTDSRGAPDASRPQSKLFAWVKHHQHICAWSSLFLAIFVFFIPDKNSLWPTGFDINAIDSKLELRILRLGEPFTKLEKLVPLAAADELQIAGRFDIPVYAGLILIDQYGAVQLLASSGDSKTKKLQYPESDSNWEKLSKGEGKEKGDEDGFGSGVILLVASDEPIKELPKKLKDLLALQVNNDSEEPNKIPGFTGSIWIRPDRTEILNEAGEARSAFGTTVSHDKLDVVTIADQVRDLLREEVIDFRGVVFPHQR